MSIKTAEIRFWTLFIILNSILFISRYVLEVNTSTFVPYTGFIDGSLFDRLEFFFKRSNFDIFRLSIDLLAATFFLYLFRRFFTVRFSTLFLFLYYTSLLLYMVYHHSFEYIYQFSPVLYNDIPLLSTGLTLVLSNQSLVTWLVLLAVAAVLIVLFYLVKHMFLNLIQAKLRNVSRLFLALMALAILISISKYGLRSRTSHVFQSQSLMIAANIKRSYEAWRSSWNFNIGKFLSSHDYAKYDFKKRPNIYMFFIESYGRILLDNPLLFRDYSAYMSEKEAMLKKAQWHASSFLSLSPVLGGQSWISYSTVLYGYNLKKDFGILLKEKGVHRYNHLFRLLKGKGYRNYRLTAICGKNSLGKIPWELYTQFYAVDEWILCKDLQYTGTLYGFGPSPNDQYSLNFTYNLIKEKGEEPYTLFFLTQNSHNPFYGPEIPAENWQDLNDYSIDHDTPSLFIKKPELGDYKKAMRFQVSYLTDFIISNGSDDDIIIIIGDHQPPVLPDPQFGYQTPVHIISRNEAFVKSFETYGFSSGLLVKDTKKSMKHEGIYSMFMREFVRHYATETEDLPEYLPDGVTFK